MKYIGFGMGVLAMIMGLCILCLVCKRVFKCCCKARRVEVIQVVQPVRVVHVDSDREMRHALLTSQLEQ